MTVVTGPATDVATVEMFFDAHRRRDIEAMVESCSRGAEFRYHPFEMPGGTQRTLSGRGKVWGIGKTIWVGMIDAFPDLTNEVTSIRSDGRGNVAVEAVLSGTQAASWGGRVRLGGAVVLGTSLLRPPCRRGRPDRRCQCLLGRRRSSNPARPPRSRLRRKGTS